jgi:parallel beta helix pectate lyase-like protein
LAKQHPCRAPAKALVGALSGALVWCTFAGLALGDPAATPVRTPLLLSQASSSEPHLPDAPEPIGPLRRDKSGKIVVIDPTVERGTGKRSCSTHAICVGPGQAFGTLSDAAAVARDGDVIEVVAGTYHDTARLARQNVTVRGIGGRPHFDCRGLRISGDKACVLLAADGITLENLEISGAEVSTALGANGACIRNESNASFTLRQIVCHGSQEGVLTDGGTIVIEDSEFYDNGWTDRTHNVYFGGPCASVTVRGSIFRDAHIGHEFKSRCQKTSISDSTFRSTHGSRDIDLPDGGEALIYRSTLTKGPGTQSEEIIGFAAESCRYPGSLVLKQVRIVNTGGETDIRNFNTCPGGAILLEGVTFEGNRPKLIGYVREQ